MTQELVLCEEAMRGLSGAETRAFPASGTATIGLLRE